MTRRTLDLIFAVGGVVVAVLVLVLGLVLQSQANFAHDEVEKQLAAQKIFFPPESALQPNENDPCLKTYAGKQLVTGKQAQCYADHYIAVHLSEVNGGIVKSCGSGFFADHAATSRSCGWFSMSTPLRKVAPARTRATR
jgi:hypothetical protein